MWLSDSLLDMEEHIIVAQINKLKNSNQRLTMYKWSFPDIDDTSIIPNISTADVPTESKLDYENKLIVKEVPVDTDDSVNKIITFLKHLSSGNGNSVLPNSAGLDTAALWDKLKESDRHYLFNNKIQSFVQWIDKLDEHKLADVILRIENNKPLYQFNAQDFITSILNSVTNTEFINITSFNGILAISCSDIIKLNYIKSTMINANIKLHDYRKKVNNEDIVIHTILYKLSDIL